jgi:hypothetical protein
MQCFSVEHIYHRSKHRADNMRARISESDCIAVSSSLSASNLFAQDSRDEREVIDIEIYLRV